MTTTRILDTTGRTTGECENHSGIIWLARECVRNGVTLETHARRAEHTGDRELADFFRHAQRLIRQCELAIARASE